MYCSYIIITLCAVIQVTLYLVLYTFKHTVYQVIHVTNKYIGFNVFNVKIIQFKIINFYIILYYDIVSYDFSFFIFILPIIQQIVGGKNLGNEISLHGLKINSSSFQSYFLLLYIIVYYCILLVYIYIYRESMLCFHLVLKCVLGDRVTSDQLRHIAVFTRVQYNPSLRYPDDKALFRFHYCLHHCC